MVAGQTAGPPEAELTEASAQGGRAAGALGSMLHLQSFAFFCPRGPHERAARTPIAELSEVLGEILKAICLFGHLPYLNR